MNIVNKMFAQKNIEYKMAVISDLTAACVIDLLVVRVLYYQLICLQQIQEMSKYHPMWTRKLTTWLKCSARFPRKAFSDDIFFSFVFNLYRQNTDNIL